MPTLQQSIYNGCLCFPILNFKRIYSLPGCNVSILVRTHESLRMHKVQVCVCGGRGFFLHINNVDDCKRPKHFGWSLFVLVFVHSGTGFLISRSPGASCHRRSSQLNICQRRLTFNFRKVYSKNCYWTFAPSLERHKYTVHLTYVGSVWDKLS